MGFVKNRMTTKTVEEDMLVDSSVELLNTIKIPVNLHYLTDRLPEPNYNPLSTRRSCTTDHIKGVKPIRNSHPNHKRSKSNVVNDRGKPHFKYKKGHNNSNLPVIQRKGRDALIQKVRMPSKLEKVSKVI